MIKNYASDNAELLERAAKGDEKSRENLILQNMGLVHSVVRRFIGRGYDTEDLIQVGCIGLIQAVEKFNSDYGVQFSTYAVPVIIGEIKRFIRDDGIIKVSRSLKDIAAKANRIKEQEQKKTGREPTITEIAEELGITSAELSTAIDAQRMPQSIYATIDDEGGALVDKIESRTDDLGEMLNRVLLEDIIERLCDRDKQIVYLRYYKQKTQAQIAKMLGISQVQVSRIEKKILLYMREKITSE